MAEVTTYKNFRREVYREARYIIRKYILRNADQFDEWFHARGDRTLSVTYPLSKESVVVEVGGYNGTWSSRIAALYDPYIYAFEPVKSFCNILSKRFENNPKVQVFPFGLWDENVTSEITLNDDGSSVYKSNGPRESIELRDICRVLEELRIPKIDLIQINIEGSEFRLLRRMLETGVTDRCANIQIQFHDVFSSAREQRQEIRLKLEASHRLRYDYPFVWESWQQKS